MEATLLNRAVTLAQDIATRAEAADRAGKLPPQDIEALTTSGYLAYPVPQAYGGAGLGLADCTYANMHLSKGSASTGMIAAMSIQVIGHAMETHLWDEPTQARFAQAVVQERAVFNHAASEPALGSPSRGQLFQTAAQRDGDEWVINGQKTWVTGGPALTHILVKLMVADQPGVILVEQESAGVEWDLTWQNTLSLRASESHDLHLRNVRVPLENCIAEQGKAPHPNGWFPMLVASVYLGAAWAARDAVIQYALERVPTALGKPIATLPKIQRQIGEIDMALMAAEALLLQATQQWDQAPAERPRLYAKLAAAKHNVVEAALFATELALKIAGGQAITPDLPIERYFRDVQAGSMQPPSGDTALEIVGKSAIEAYQQR